MSRPDEEGKERVMAEEETGRRGVVAEGEREREHRLTRWLSYCSDPLLPRFIHLAPVPFSPCERIGRPHETLRDLNADD